MSYAHVSFLVQKLYLLYRETTRHFASRFHEHSLLNYNSRIKKSSESWHSVTIFKLAPIIFEVKSKEALFFLKWSSLH